MHPHAAQIALGFREGLKVFYPIEDELRLVLNESLKACHAVAYNDTGSVLAVGNNNVINLYGAYNFELTGQFTGHPSPIKSLRFAYDMHSDPSPDKCKLHLVSTCQNGVLYVWNVGTGERIQEHTWKTSRLTTQFYDERFEISLDSDVEVNFFKNFFTDNHSLSKKKY
jgi:hypothetical protein